MAFEPRIVRPDDDAFSDDAGLREIGLREIGPNEIASADPVSGGRHRSEAEERWLPDDLQELAAQLGVDAARLTASHPPTPRVYERNRFAARQWLPRIAGAAVLLISAGFWMAGRGERSAARPDGLAASTAKTAANGGDDRMAASLRENASYAWSDNGAGLIVEASGRKIGSVDQAVDLILASPPGETIGLVVERAGKRLPVQITLCSEPAVNAVRQSPGAGEESQRNMRVAGRDHFDARNGNPAHVAELSVDNNALPQRGPRDELSMLQLQVQAFGRVIAKLQAEVLRRDQLLAETNDLVKSLTAEVETLRKQQVK